MENIKAIILAAGAGTRMKSKTPKVLHKVAGKPMLQYVIDAAEKSGAKEVCVVIGYGADEIKVTFHKETVQFALQEEQLGTGHAAMQALDFVGEQEDVFVLYGDTPLIQGTTLEKVLAYHRAHHCSATVVSAFEEDPTGYGHIVRDENNNFVKIVEHKDATEAEKAIHEINTGIYCFKGEKLKEALGKLTNDNIQKEYYLTDTVEILLTGGDTVHAMMTEDASEFAGVNSRKQLAEAEKVMRRRINEYFMEHGVTMIDPERTYIGPDVEIGADTILYPGTILEGKTVIGEDCVIGPDSRISNMKIGNRVTVQYTTALNSEIGDDTNVGPYAYIRPNCRIGSHIKIGDFVEVKNSVIGDGTKVSHLTYIGDSDVGSGINFGCGTVTVNYDGEKKYRTVIEDNVFIGCNANLVAPVTIQKGSYIAAGSTITKDVPEKALAVARARQENIKGWTKKRK